MTKTILNFFVKRIIFDDNLLKELKENQDNQPVFFIIRKKSYISYLLFIHHAKKFFDESLIYVPGFKEDTDLKYVLDHAGIILLSCDESLEPYENQLLKTESIMYVSLILWSRTNRFKTKNERFIYPSGFIKFLLLVTRSGRAEIIISQKLEKNDLKTGELDKQIRKKIEEERQSILGRPVSRRKELINSILTDQTFLNQLNEIKEDKKNIKRAKRYLYEIATNRNYPSIGRFAKFLEFMFSKMTDGIVVDKEGIERAREISKTKQIVYLPSHRSHADYLLTGLFFYKSKLNIPLFAAGINMAFFPFGAFFRRLGAFFLRRSFRNNRVYALCFKTYLQFLIHEGNNQLFYIEGGRSRTGKLLQPKLGMLSIIMTMIKENRIDDLYFIPVSIDYSKLFEDKSYISELAGKEKKDESFLSILESAKLLKQKQGKIYIQFGHGFPIREYLKQNQININTDDQSEFQKNVEKIGRKVIHEINSVVTITPSSILSLVLLSNPGRSIKELDLLRASKMIHNYLKTKNARTILDPNELEYALKHILNNFIKNQLLHSIDTDLGKVYKVKPYNRLYFDYYKNSIIHLFLPLAFISTVFKSSREDELSLNFLYKELDLLKAIFEYEFIFAESVWNERGIHDILKFFVITKEIQIRNEKIYFHPKKNIWMDIGYRIIKNYLESYYSCFDFLINKGKASNEKETLKSIIRYGKSLYDVGTLEFHESISKENYKNALNLIKKFNKSEIAGVLKIDQSEALVKMRDKLDSLLFI